MDIANDMSCEHVIVNVRSYCNVYRITDIRHASLRVDCPQNRTHCAEPAGKTEHKDAKTSLGLSKNHHNWLFAFESHTHSLYASIYLCIYAHAWRLMQIYEAYASIRNPTLFFFHIPRALVVAVPQDYR